MRWSWTSADRSFRLALDFAARHGVRSEALAVRLALVEIAFATRHNTAVLAACAELAANHSARAAHEGPKAGFEWNEAPRLSPGLRL
jgi:hypothetical protein